MSKYYESLYDSVTAGWKVTYDKCADYATYYIYGSECKEPVQSNENNIENEEDFDEVINYDKIKLTKKFDKEYDNFKLSFGCTDENETTRVQPELSMYDRFAIFFADPTYIVDNIYLGSAFNAASESTLQKYNIKMIINITKEISEYYPGGNYIYKKYKIYDDNQDSILKILEPAYNDIIQFQKEQQENDTDGNILIHCFMGRSRSACLTMYYLMKTQRHNDGKRYNSYDALLFIRKKRPTVNPTFKLIKDLINLTIEEKIENDSD